jgi:photosystem II stability/assembly factor-like uncharacterized protein
MRFLAKTLLLIFIFASFQTVRAEWIKQTINTFSWLHTVHFIDQNTGWIGGSRGTLLATTDGGQTWQQQPKFTDDKIREVFFWDKMTGWILCEKDIFSLGASSPSYFMKTTNGGKTWERIDFENKQRRRITKMFFARNGFGLAIGETGALLGLEDDNLTWRRLAPPSRYLMLDGVFTDNLKGMVVGGGGTILFTEDAGASWNQAYVADDARPKLNSVFFVNTRNGWTVGSQGKIYQTGNGGKYWRLQRTNTTRNLNDVFFSDALEGWVVGDDGMILHTTTAGSVWQEVDTASKHKLEKVFFIGKKGWIVGFGGTLLAYQAAGKSDAKRPKFRTSK